MRMCAPLGAEQWPRVPLSTHPSNNAVLYFFLLLYNLLLKHSSLGQYRGIEINPSVGLQISESRKAVLNFTDFGDHDIWSGGYKNFARLRRAEFFSFTLGNRDTIFICSALAANLQFQKRGLI